MSLFSKPLLKTQNTSKHLKTKFHYQKYHLKSRHRIFYPSHNFFFILYRCNFFSILHRCVKVKPSTNCYFLIFFLKVPISPFQWFCLFSAPIFRLFSEWFLCHFCQILSEERFGAKFLSLMESVCLMNRLDFDKIAKVLNENC